VESDETDLACDCALVVVTDLNSQGGEQTLSEIAAAGGHAVFQHADVTTEAEIRARPALQLGPRVSIASARV
jgi:NAD(P)-dependent dehydrogenase (short-subunit alcohol dehydrogenase family)